MNKENFQKVLDKIESCPAEWNQHHWHCGTQHCFAGHAQLLSGKSADESTVKKDARLFLQLSQNESSYLFTGVRTLTDFKKFLAGYDRDGYNRAGYDRDGYDRAGYNHDGYYRAGYNRDGYDSAGYNRAGYDRDGYNRDGYDSAGYNSAGYNRDGYNSDGYDSDGLKFIDGEYK